MKTFQSVSYGDAESLLDGLRVFLAIATGTRSQLSLQPVVACLPEEASGDLTGKSSRNNRYLSSHGLYPIVLDGPWTLQER